MDWVFNVLWFLLFAIAYIRLAFNYNKLEDDRDFWRKEAIRLSNDKFKKEEQCMERKEPKYKVGDRVFISGSLEINPIDI